MVTGFTIGFTQATCHVFLGSVLYPDRKQVISLLHYDRTWPEALKPQKEAKCAVDV